MANSHDTDNKRPRPEAGGLMRDVRDEALRRLRTRLAESSLADLKGLFLRARGIPEDGQKGREPKMP